MGGGRGSPAWSDINAKERSSLYARRRGSIPLLTPLKLIFFPATARNCERRRRRRMRGRRRERKKKEEGNRVEKGKKWKKWKIYISARRYPIEHRAAENLECLVIDGLNINVSRRGSSNDLPTRSRFFPSIIFFSRLKDISALSRAEMKSG